MKRGKRGKHIWEEDDIKFLHDNYKNITNRQLADGLGIRLTTCRTKLYELGLKRMELELWKPEQVQFLRDNYKTMGDVEMAEIFESEYKKEKGWSNKHIEKKRRYLKLKRTQAQIKKIKKRNVRMGRFAECAKKRWETMGVTPAGDIRIWNYTYGGVFAVIKLENGFVHYNRWLYENTYGKLDSESLVVTKSGKTIAEGHEDLEIIDRAEHSRRNSLKRYPEEFRETIQLIWKLKRQINQ